jgi:hypothetical protein
MEAITMFQSIFGRGKAVFDPALGDRLGKVILKEAQQGKLTTLLRHVEPLRDDEWDLRAFYITLAAQHLAKPHRVQRLDDTPLHNLIKGRVGIQMAWQARGYGTGDTVTDELARLFFKHLNFAEQHLLRAAEHDHEDPTPFAFLQTVARGLQKDRDIADSWFHEAIRRDSTNQQAHAQHLLLLCKKWGGSHEEMYDFARVTVQNTPPGSTLSSILFLAFQEQYLYFLAFERDQQGARAFLHNKHVRKESLAVYERSLQQRNRIECLADYWPHNLAAWWFLKLDMPDVVRQETKKIGRYCTEDPWAIFTKDPAEWYQEALDL